MGALSGAIKELTIQKLGRVEGWERNVHLINQIWTRIEEAINSWALPYERVRLYQDGLPVCRQGTRNRSGSPAAVAITGSCCV